jgi:hypothetical protein
VIYRFSLPVSGKMIEWGPLKVGAELKLTQSLPGDVNRGRLGIELLMSRVASVTSPEGQTLKAPIQQSEWETWDSFDMDAFREEVETQEAARRAAFRRKQQPEGRVDSEVVDYHVDQVESALAGLATALRNAREAIVLAEQQNRPLTAAS